MRGRWVVDRRTEVGAAVHLENGRLIDLPDLLLPRGVREGDHLRVSRTEDGEGMVRLRIHRDDEATAGSREDARARLDRLARRDPGGDHRV